MAENPEKSGLCYADKFVKVMHSVSHINLFYLYISISWFDLRKEVLAQLPSEFTFQEGGGENSVKMKPVKLS